MYIENVIKEAIDYEFSLNNDEYRKKENFLKVIEMICLKFLKIKENITENEFSQKIEEHLKEYYFVNDEYLYNIDNIITPNMISELYYHIFYSDKNDGSNYKSKNKKGVFYTLNSYAYNFTKELLYKYLCRQCNISENTDEDYNYKIFENINNDLIEANIRSCKILDIGCGTGNLIFNMIVNIYELKEKLNLKVELNEIIDNCTAIDIDNMALNVLKVRLFLYLSKKRGYCYLNECKKLFSEEYSLIEFRNIYQADVLEELDIEKETFNIIISNPPYIKIEKSKIKNYIQVFGITSAKNYDITYIFIHKIMEYIKYCGIVGLITKNTYLQNDSAESIRKILFNNFTLISLKKEKNIFNKKVQTLAVSTILQKVSNKTFLGLDKTLNNNKIFDLENNYQINFINDKMFNLKDKLSKANKNLSDYFYLNKNGKNKVIEDKNIYRYCIDDERFKFDYSNVGFIIIPSECQLNRFAAIDENPVKYVGGATIIIRPDSEKLDLDCFIYFICLLNSNLIYFWIIVNGKFNSKDVLRVTVDIIKKIPIRNIEGEFYKKIVQAFWNYISNNENIIEFQNKIDDSIYSIYNVNEDEILLIKNCIKEYESNPHISAKLKK